jgi:branched-chain amino acid transport system permease protein
VALGLFLIFALLPLFAAISGKGYLLSLFARVMIFSIAALSLDLLAGYGGLISFGHAAFMGLGAYAVGILSAHGVQETLLSLPAAILAAALFALLTGCVCLRTKGVYFIMITLAFGQMAFFTASSLAPYGGDDGLTIAARNTLAGFALLRNEQLFYYVVLGCVLGTYLFCRMLIGTRFGRVFQGARENAVRMETMGFDVYRFQLIAYVIAGSIGGLSGFLLANATEFVSPAYMSWQRSGDLIIMVVLGGLGTLNGAIMGAAAYLLLEEWLSGFTEDWKVIFGPLLVLAVLYARGGLVHAGDALFRRLRS